MLDLPLPPSLLHPADALLGQLLGQLSGPPQQAAPASMALPQHPGLAQHMAALQQQMQGGPSAGGGEASDSAIQALLAQASLMSLGGGAGGVAPPSGAPTSAPGSAVGLASPPAGSAPRGPGSALSAGALSTGTASPTHSLSAPMPTPLFNGGGGLGGGQGPPSARGAGSYLGTSPTATHSSAGDTGECSRRRHGWWCTGVGQVPCCTAVLAGGWLSGLWEHSSGAVLAVLLQYVQGQAAAEH